MTSTRSHRHLANLSLRQLAELTSFSNPYLSQVERGLHHPSVRVVKLIADALDLSTETLLEHAGLVTCDESDESAPSVRPRSARTTGSPTSRRLR
jgi:transcriptional regulator with XRE-family HTH domain